VQLLLGSQPVLLPIKYSKIGRMKSSIIQDMPNHSHLAGVYAAAITPLHPDYSPDLEALPSFLKFLAGRGCHGALLLGTTGEGPSFAAHERLAIFKAAQEARRSLPGFRLLAGTGTPSLEETILLTRAAFEAGLDGVVVLPPYYFRTASMEGLFRWYSEVIRRSVPEEGALLGYHIPSVSGVPIPIELLARLKDSFQDRFAGLKDSSGDPEHAQRLQGSFGNDLLVLNGNDRYFSLALEAGASGAITALANLLSPDLRQVWENPPGSQERRQAQERLNAARQVMDRYPPTPSTLKALLARQFSFPLWAVRPPLLPISPETTEQVARELFTNGQDRL
jgi:4-hydroxy-tetrahydrodipicolinate synthase